MNLKPTTTFWAFRGSKTIKIDGRANGFYDVTLESQEHEILECIRDLGCILGLWMGVWALKMRVLVPENHFDEFVKTLESQLNFKFISPNEDIWLAKTK